MQNNKNFGISDSLIETVKEALKGNQKKLDVDGDGKLEKSDFEKLRARKEDVEVDEAQSNWEKARKENQRSTVGNLNYGKKTYVDRKINPYKSDLRKDAEKAMSDFRARGGKIRKEEVEEASKCNSTNEGTMCEVHGNKACPTMAEAVYSVSWGVGLDTQVVAKDAGEALSKAKQNLLKRSPKLSDPKYSDTWKKRPSISKLRETTEEVEIDEEKVAAYDKDGKQVGLYRNMADAKRLKPGHTYKIHKEEVSEADEDPVAKQIAAKKEQLKKQIQQKIAQKQMSVMQQKAQKKIQNIKASNDKDVDDNMKKKGKDEVEVNPELREAEDLPKKVIKKGHEIAKSLIKHKAKVDEPYAVGMAQAKKSAGIKD